MNGSAFSVLTLIFMPGARKSCGASSLAGRCRATSTTAFTPLSPPEKTTSLTKRCKHSSLVFYVDEFVNAMLSRWALVGVLSGFERYLKQM